MDHRVLATASATTAPACCLVLRGANGASGRGRPARLPGAARGAGAEDDWGECRATGGQSMSVLMGRARGGGEHSLG